jgi:formiminotetrahydrofolate cyclodeaminase
LQRKTSEEAATRAELIDPALRENKSAPISVMTTQYMAAVPENE